MASADVLPQEDEEVDTKFRVKFFVINANGTQWDDRGTGHVASCYCDGLKTLSFVVVDEDDGSVLLESKILTDTPYRREQETVIAWKEGGEIDLALSFQEKTGCDDIWKTICQLQGADPTLDHTQIDDRYLIDPDECDQSELSTNSDDDGSDLSR